MLTLQVEDNVRLFFSPVVPPELQDGVMLPPPPVFSCSLIEMFVPALNPAVDPPPNPNTLYSIYFQLLYKANEVYLTSFSDCA